MSRGIIRLKLLRRCRARRWARCLSVRACGLGRGVGGDSAVWPVKQVLDCLIRPLLLSLDLFMAWVLRRQRLLLNHAPGRMPSSRRLVRSQFDRCNVEGIEVRDGLRSVHHDFVAGHLDWGRVDLVVTPSRHLAGEFGNETNRVVRYGPAVEEVDFGLWLNHDVDWNRPSDGCAVELGSCNVGLTVDGEWRVLGARNW